MSDMVERVLATLRGCRTPDDDGAPFLDIWHDGENIARAAIAAMRQPSLAMLDAMDARKTDFDRWTAAIDEALE